MPWFPEFVSAVELARQQTRAAGQADPVGQYFTALNEGDAHTLETVLARTTPTAAPPSSARSTPGASARAAASAFSTAW
jgi:hypothetical protein